VWYRKLFAFDLTNIQRKRMPFAIWVTRGAIIVIAALALIMAVVAWFAIP
jgi:cell division septal protein FtsQ